MALAGCLLGGAVPGHAETFYEDGFTGTITSATGALAPLCPAGNCNNVSGTMLIQPDLIPAKGSAYLNPMFYDFSSYAIDLQPQDFFSLDIGGDTTGYYGLEGSTAGFFFNDGHLVGIGLETVSGVPGTYQGYVLQFSGLSFIGYPITGEFYETGPAELFGFINPEFTSMTPYYPDGVVPTPEPGSVVLLGSGALGVVEMMRRRLRR